MLLRISSVVLMALAFAACRENLLEPDLEHEWVNGVIADVRSGDLKEILIEKVDGDGERVENGRRIWFSITDETVILRATDFGFLEAFSHNVKQGRGASAITYGEVHYSDPPQAHADSLILRY